MRTPKNLVVIIREVGRDVCRFSHPVTLDLVAARLRRMVLSMSLQNSRARNEHQPQCFDTPRRFEEQCIDKDRVLEERKVVLHRVLILVDREQLSAGDSRTSCNRVLGLPLYYLGQFFVALSVGLIS